MEKIEVLDEDVEGMSVEFLKGLLSLIEGCGDCGGCSLEVNMLRKMIAEKENR